MSKSDDFILDEGHNDPIYTPDLIEQADADDEE